MIDYLKQHGNYQHKSKYKNSEHLDIDIHFIIAVSVRQALLQTVVLVVTY